MSIHEHLPGQDRKALQEVGWTKGLELAKLAREERVGIRLCNLAAQSPSNAEGGLQEGGRAGTKKEGNGTVGDCLLQTVLEPNPVIEKVIETAVLMLGSDRSRGYCMEMVCADFSGGLQPGQRRLRNTVVLDDEILQFLPGEQQQAFLGDLSERRHEFNWPRLPRLRLDGASYERLRQQVLRRDGWRCQAYGAMSTLQVHHQRFRSPRVPTRRKLDHSLFRLPRQITQLKRRRKDKSPRSKKSAADRVNSPPKCDSHHRQGYVFVG